MLSLAISYFYTSRRFIVIYNDPMMYRLQVRLVGKFIQPGNQIYPLITMIAQYQMRFCETYFYNTAWFASLYCALLSYA